MSMTNVRSILFLLITMTTYHSTTFCMQAGPSKEKTTSSQADSIMELLQHLFSQHSVVDTSRGDGVFAQVRENRLDDERLPRNPLNTSTTLPRVHMWVSFLLLQEQVMQQVRINCEAQEKHLARSREAYEQYADLYTYTIDPIAGIRTRVCMLENTPELTAANIFLVRAQEEQMAPETILTILLEKFEHATDRRIKIALLFKIIELYDTIRDQALHSAVSITWKLLTTSPLIMMRPLAGYCYPTSHWYALVNEYGKILNRQQHDGSFSEASWTADDQAHHEQRKELAAWYERHAKEFDNLKAQLLEKLKCGIHHSDPKHDKFLYNYFDEHQLLPLDLTAVGVLPPIDPSLLRQTKSTRKKKFSKKKCAATSPSVEITVPDEEGAAAPSTSDQESDTTSDDTTPTEAVPREAKAASSSASPIHRSIPYLYLERVLDWHLNPAQALLRPEYGTLPRHVQEEIIIKHRLPFALEERYKKHAIKSQRKNALCADGHALVLNFPGAICYQRHNEETGRQELRYLLGYFAIDINPHTHEIYHRCFHEKTTAELEDAIRTRQLQAEFPPLDNMPTTQEHTTIHATADNPYTIHDDGLRIHIIDENRVTYILFKKPIIRHR